MMDKQLHCEDRSFRKRAPSARRCKLRLWPALERDKREAKRSGLGFSSPKGGQTQPDLTVAHREGLQVSFN